MRFGPRSSNRAWKGRPIALPTTQIASIARVGVAEVGAIPAEAVPRLWPKTGSQTRIADPLLIEVNGEEPQGHPVRCTGSVLFGRARAARRRHEQCLPG